MTCPITPHDGPYAMNLQYEDVKVNGQRTNVYQCSECSSLADEDGNYVEAGAIK